MRGLTDEERRLLEGSFDVPSPDDPCACDDDWAGYERLQERGLVTIVDYPYDDDCSMSLITSSGRLALECDAAARRGLP